MLLYERLEQKLNLAFENEQGLTLSVSPYSVLNGNEECFLVHIIKNKNKPLEHFYLSVRSVTRLLE